MSRTSVSRPRHKRHAADVGHGVAAMLCQAVQLHQTGQLDAAEVFYRKTLHLQAGQPDALHFLGVLCHQRGRSDEGIRLIRMALRVVPQHADVHNNLGNIHKETSNLAAAEACYRQALACSRQHHDALSNLALVLEAQERPREASQAYADLLEQAPQLSRAHYLMGMYLRRHVNETMDLEQAVDCFRNAIRCDGGNVRALDALGVTLYMLGRQTEAVGAYRGWLDREPDNPLPRHMLAACGGEAAPSRADDAYVREVFDRFAESFDEQLLKNLDYRAPQVLVDALIGVLGVAEGTLDVLDAGCGTGLCGPLIRPHARRLYGVDLSSGMLEKARLRGGYDELVAAELTAYLQDHPETWDVVLSADTLVYFGDLTEVLAATQEALRAGGWVAFTLEAMDADEDRSELSSSGRYRHTRRYVERVLDAAGFVDVGIAASALRKEVGKPVNGWVVLARKVERIPETVLIG
jgi:predicted TPR repeat methyltransferase